MAAADADVVRGRCLPYGEGITFWPLSEVMRAAANITADDTPEAAVGRFARCVSDEQVVERLASAMGLSAQPFPLAELSWGVRRALELITARRPWIVIDR